jgi:hypothetical protein
VALGRTPEPSKRFHSITLPITEIDRDWYRSHPTRRGAVYFGRNRAYRFDAPDGEYGLLYAGGDPHVVFIESFQIVGIHRGSGDAVKWPDAGGGPKRAGDGPGARR